MKQILIYIVTAFFASHSYGMIFKLRGKDLIWGGIGGGIGWAIFKSLFPHLGLGISITIGTIFVACFAEVMARVLKLPASVFVLTGMLPLVPGEGIFLTMRALVEGNNAAFAQYGRETFMISGLMALSILFVSSLARTIPQIRHFRQAKRQAGERHN